MGGKKESKYYIVDRRQFQNRKENISELERLANQIPTNRDKVYEEYAHLIPYNNIVVPIEHRYNKKNPHSLRCFKKIFQRDKDGNKLYDLPRRRCRNHVVEGYLYCRFHGGRLNLPAKTADEKDKSNSLVSAYRNVYDAEMSDLLEVFLNDPSLLDLKPDLASLRLILNKYIQKLTQKANKTSIADFMQRVRDILMDDTRTEEQKYNAIMELAEGQTTLLSGKAIDRIYRCVEQIGRTVERIKKIEQDENFLLTPDGLKIMLRAIIDLLDNTITDDSLKVKIKQGLLSLSIETNGNIVNYNRKNENIVDVEVIEGE